MKEVKTPRKPLAIYYAIVLLMLLLLNFVLLPWMEERQIKEVDYGTFMTMTEEKNIGRVDIESNQIIFTDKDETQVYKTGLMNDTGLTERLYDAGATFSSEIVEQSSPVLSFLIWFVLPIILFSAIGNQMNKKLMEKAGGGPGSMMFGGMGKSNAKVYVQSTAGIRFADVAGEDEAKENLQEVVNYLHDPSKYESIGAKMPKGILLVGPPGTGKTMLAKAVAGESNVPFFSISGSEFVEMFVMPVCFALSVTPHFFLMALPLFKLPFICFLLFCQHRFPSGRSSAPQLTKSDLLIFLLFLFSSLAELRFVRYNFSSTDDRMYRAFTVTERIYHL